MLFNSVQGTTPSTIWTWTGFCSHPYEIWTGHPPPLAHQLRFGQERAGATHLGVGDISEGLQQGPAKSDKLTCRGVPSFY